MYNKEEVLQKVDILYNMWKEKMCYKYIQKLIKEKITYIKYRIVKSRKACYNARVVENQA